MITPHRDLTEKVRIAGNVRPEAMEAAYDRGALEPDRQLDHVFLLMKRSPEREAALAAFLRDVNDDTSPVFHKWLTAEELGRDYGPSAGDLEQVTTWLKSEGLKVNTVYTTGMTLDVSGSVENMNKAFGVKMHKLSVNGVDHIANSADPEIPAAFAGVMAGVVSLNSFRPHPQYRNKVAPVADAKGVVNPNYTFTSGTAQYELVTPGDLSTIYNLKQAFNAGFTGQGQTIGVVEDTDVYTVADWTTFRAAFKLDQYTQGSFTQNHPAPATGGTTCTAPGVNADDGEAILDAEYASAGAPSAAIVLEACADTSTTFGGYIAMQNLLNTGKSPSVLSISYGESEVQNGATANAAYSSLYQMLTAQGVSVFVSSGDEGAASSDANKTKATHGITVSGFASTPYNVAVGGTDFSDTPHGTVSTYWSTTNNADQSSALSYIEEQPWNDSCASRILAKSFGYTTTYGSTGFCNSTTATSQSAYLSTGGGSGGPSNCATGVAQNRYVANGTCAGYAKPAFQGAVINGTYSGVLGVPNDNVRDIPDVSLFAANGLWGHYYPYCYSDPGTGRYGASCAGAPSTWAGAGGTSFASPIVASMQALVNQVTGSIWGNPLPTYYNLAAQQFGTTGNDSCNSSAGNQVNGGCAFFDVTIGDIDVNCTGAFNCYIPSGTNGVLSTSNTAYLPAYRSAVGWDFATGIGTINASAMINRWNTVSHSTPRYY